MKKLLVLVMVIIALVPSLFAQTQNPVPKVMKPVYFDVSPPLRDLVKRPPAVADRSWKDGVVKNFFNLRKGKEGAPDITDPCVQDQNGMTLTDTTIQNFDGVNNVNGYIPPDTHGDVGPNHYFQVVNASYAIYNKSGVKIFGPANSSTVWEGLPNNANSGDAVVIYDEQADRWLSSQFSLPTSPAGPFYQMIAVSQTNDPTGSWYRYQYSFTDLPDYPKFGVWPDGYYMSCNLFTENAFDWAGTGACAFDRTAMLAGNSSATMVYFTLPSTNDESSQLPSDCDGPFPPAGTPNYFTFIYDITPQHLGVREFHVNWTTPSSSTFAPAVTLSVNSFSNSLSSGIAQKGTTKKLDAISDRLMYRLQYRKFTNYQSMVTCHSVNIGSGVAGVRWYELRNTGSGWSVYQQSTYGPSDGNSRWMGSIAMDTSGNIALGYSVSGSNMYPSIRYTGRMKNDALNTMTIAERGIINGGGSQTGGGTPGRWGDYSSMSVDPSASCTFWYTTEYYTATSSGSWKTRVGSFSFLAPMTVDATATPSTIAAGQTSQLNVVATGGTGTYSYAWSSIPSGFTSNIQNPVASPLIDTRYIATVTSGPYSGTDTTDVTVTLQVTATATPSSITVGQSSQLNASPSGGTGTYTYLWSSIPAGYTSNMQNPVVYPTATTQYVVQVTSAAQTASDTVTVTVSMNPLVVIASATPSSLCAGGTSQLNASASGGTNVYSYSWTSIPAGFTSDVQNPQVQPTETTQYIVAVNDTTQIVNDTATVYVTASPVCFAGNDTIICSYIVQVDLNGTASGYSSVMWSTSGDGIFNDASTLTAVYFPGIGDRASGSFDLSLTASPVSPCVNSVTDVVHFTIDPCTGIAPLNDYQFGITLKPNPASDVAFLTITGVKGKECRISLTDMKGNKVFEEKRKSPQSVFTRKISLAGFAKGVYLVKVECGDEQQTEKLSVR